MSTLVHTLFLLTLTWVFVAGQSCYWSRCAAFNQPSCGPDREVTRERCGGLINRKRAFCCRMDKCGHTGECIPTGCKGARCPDPNAKCASGQTVYEDKVEPIDCEWEVPGSGISMPGKKYFCCNP